VADGEVKRMVAPRQRFVVVEAMGKIVGGRRPMTIGEGFGGAELLADVNMKRDLEVNALKTSETRGGENSRMQMIEWTATPPLPPSHF
jgi:hypothetical protein